MEFPRNRKPPREVSLIPLIDVAMFLLIFFLVAGTIEKFELIPIDPPAAESGKLIDEGHIVILLGAHGEVVMDDELIDVEELEARIRPLVKLNPRKVITIKADGTIPAARMIAVMDRIKLAGGKNLSIATKALSAAATGGGR